MPAWPWTFATLPAGNVAASKLDDNFNAAMFSAGSSTNGAVPTWNGTTGTALNTGGLVVGTGANNLVQLDGSGLLPTSIIPPTTSGLAYAYATLSGGVWTIQKGSGISSITYNSTGNFTVNMSPAMPDTNYCALITFAGNTNFYWGEISSTRSTTSFQMYVGGDNIGAQNPSAVNIRVFA